MYCIAVDGVPYEIKKNFQIRDGVLMVDDQVIRRNLPENIDLRFEGQKAFLGTPQDGNVRACSRRWTG